MLQITFRNMPSTASIWELARKEHAKLEHASKTNPSCRLVLEHQPRLAQQDEQYCAHITVRLSAERVLQATAEAGQPETAISDVFGELERQLGPRCEMALSAAT